MFLQCASCRSPSGSEFVRQPATLQPKPPNVTAPIGIAMLEPFIQDQKRQHTTIAIIENRSIFSQLPRSRLIDLSEL
jgi:hypothetical protein